MIYLSLFVVCFMVATILPFGSEIYFASLLAMDNNNSLLLLIAASTVIFLVLHSIGYADIMRLILFKKNGFLLIKIKLTKPPIFF